MAVLTPEQTHAPVLRGLSESEAQARRQRGEGNNIRLATSRSYGDIIRNNLFNLMNIILFTIGAVMVFIGRPGEAITSVGLIVLNVGVGIVQEVRAKRQLDKIALLTRPKISVMRDGQEKPLDPSELVKGDLIVIRAGDQIVVDGVVVGDGKIDVDESLLTGESDLIAKTTGDEVLSGSFCVTGSAMIEATKVGAESFANQLTANARQYRIVKTPLQREIDFLLRLIMLLAGFIGFLMLVVAILSALPIMRQVQIAAVVAGLVPNGLFFMVILAYAMGAVRIVRQGALVQQTNAVESLSNVTVLCMDKTGTLTANKINYSDIYPVGMNQDDLLRILGDFAASASANNKTGEAVLAAIPGTKQPFVDEVPFSSARKWSALAFDGAATGGALQGVYVLGALEMLEDYLPFGQDALDKLAEWTDCGLRVLVFGHNPDVTTLHDIDSNPALPLLTPLGVICFSDELRPRLVETLAGFRDSGITLKVISGDNPATVAALAKQAGFAGDLRYVSGKELDALDDLAFQQVATEATIFGRITPQQKERLVEALRAQGNYVAMIGDGVNDVLSLKKANMGIAMQSGSAATRAVADMILLEDSFGALPPAFTEGQRIVNAMADIMRLFLSRVLYVALLIIAVRMVGLGFPFIPKHVSLLVLLSVGIPTFGIAVWARPGARSQQGGLIREVLHFVIPAGMCVFFFGFMIYVAAFFLSISELVDFQVTPDDIATFQRYTGIDYDITAEDYLLEVSQLVAQTALTSFTMFAGFLLVIFAEPPHPFFTGGDKLSGDLRPTLLTMLMFGVYIAILLSPPLRTFYELVALPISAYLLLGLVTVIWFFVQRMAWRGRWLDRFLGTDLGRGMV
ncbi:MAG: HAD-IC family P-type ATPase [bacterium]|nr:HAD-IC family P-type ATPase [bacterium]